MGWLWDSTQEKPVVKPPSQNTAQEPTPTEPNQLSNHSGSTEAEGRAFLESAEATEHAPLSPYRSKYAADESPDSSSEPITPDSTLPSSLRCSSSFDMAFYCQSLGGQFINVYRYGGMRSCSEHWSDFWFCVKTNRSFMNEERKAETIRAWALNKEREKYGKGGDGSSEGNEDGIGMGDELGKVSSEDVWKVRRWKVRGAFAADWGVLERDAEEMANLKKQKEVRQE